MTELRTVGANDWQAMRDIRLDALREAPYAFASTYAWEAAFPEQTWRERASSGNSILAYLPEFDRGPVGLVAAIQEVAGELELVSMWVRPQARGRQVGSALVEAIVERARRAGCHGCTCG
jgi:GNAT superfamily N-acetyltransferase